MISDGLWILASAVLLAASVVPARANLIPDPGFESCALVGDAPPGWTASSGNIFCYGSTTPHTGNFDVVFTATASTLSQTITTIAGDNYDFSFWLWDAAGTGSAPDFFTASFGSDEVLDLVNHASFTYTLEDFTVTATGTSTMIEFGAESNGQAWILDDVSVTDQGPATPEPASLVLLASGLLGIAWRFRRQRRAPEQVTILPYAQFARSAARNTGKR